MKYEKGSIMGKRLLFLLVLLPIIIIGCSDRRVNVDESEIIGTYLYNGKDCFDSLEIRPDNIYVQYYRTLDGTLDSNVSRWILIHFSGGSMIVFSEYAPISPNRGHKQSGGLGSDIYMSRSGQLKILVSVDPHKYYVKQNK